MPEIRHENHGTNVTLKAIRFSDMLKATDAAEVPAALSALARTGEYGAKLAELCWSEITKAMPPRESVNGPAPESVPGAVTVSAIVGLCQFPTIMDPELAATVERAKAEAEVFDPFDTDVADRIH